VNSIAASTVTSGSIRTIFGFFGRVK
jgi:hypothetical protein